MSQPDRHHDRHLEPVGDTSEPGDFDTSQPADIRAEQVVLGAMMLTPNAIADTTDLLRADDFYQPRHTILYNLILDAFSRGEPTDLTAIHTRLATTGTLNQIGGGAYLHTLAAAVPTVANTTWYARTVAAKAARRRLIEAAARITQIATRHPDDNPTDLADQASAALYDATDQHITTDVVTIGDILQPALDAIETGAASNHGTGIPTGLADLDTATGGPQPGQLWIVAGRPGMGKSVHATDIARSATIRHGRPALFCSLEMSREELMDRVLSAESSVRHERILDAKRGKINLTDDEWVRIAHASADIAEAPLHIDDTATTGLAAIRAKARRLAQRGGLDMLIVDYLQLMQHSTGRRSDNREREVAELSRGLKILAKELAIPVLAVCQLNRNAEMRHDKTPQLGDLRESGGLENDADVVVLVHRDDYYTKTKSERPGEVDLIVAKNRHGAQPTIAAAAQLHYQRFADMAPASH